MNPDSILLLATKCTVIAFDRASGRRLWQTALKEGWTNQDFVTLAADAERVFATTKGELFCLELATGRLLWKDGLPGLGYGIASLALPRFPPSQAAGDAEHRRRIEESRRSSSDANRH